MNNINSLLNELNKIMLSIDMSIKEDVHQQLIKITEQLDQQWQNDKVLLTFVKMVRALSDYAASGKSNVNSDAISMIHSLVGQMEALASSPGINMPMSKKQSILSEEIVKYNKLKQQIKSTQKEKSQTNAYNADVSFQVESDSNIIAELKSVILSLEWEITDELIHKLDREINRLQSHWQNSKIHLSFLQMFKSIGSYVLSRGSNTLPDSVSLLNSLYRNFEQIVFNPSMTMSEQKDILLGEIKKFNDLKLMISSAKTSNKPHPQPNASPALVATSALRNTNPAMSPMDDLIGTKSSSNLSPVDELIEEIHMLQDSGDRSHSLDTNVMPHGSDSKSANPEIKEVVPNRLKTQPISEIQTRLDSFFDEDAPLSDFSFADSGDEVVPYNGDTTTSGYAPETTNVVTPDSVVPYDFENEFFEEETDFQSSPDGQKKQSAAMQQSMELHRPDVDLELKRVSDIQMSLDVDMTSELLDIEDVEATEEGVLLEKLKSALGQCLLDGSFKEIETINDKISALEKLLNENPEKFILLKAVKSLSGYSDLPAVAPEDQPFELMLYIVESIEKILLQSTQNRSSGIIKGEKSGGNNIIDVFSKYIDFQNNMVVIHSLSDEQVYVSDKTGKSERDYSDRNGYSEQLHKAEIIEDRDGSPDQEDTLAIEKKITEPKGIWGKIKNLLGFS